MTEYSGGKVSLRRWRWRPTLTPLNGAGLLVVIVILMTLLPVGKPSDQSSTLYLDPYYKPIAVIAIRHRGGYRNRLTPFLPQSIELSCPSAFNAYLLDVEPLSIEALLKLRATAQQQLSDGTELDVGVKILQSALGKSHCSWKLRNWYWGHAHYMLLVAPVSKTTTEVHLRIGYGGRQSVAVP